MPADSDLFLALRAGDIASIRAVLAVDPARALARDTDGVSLLMTALYHRSGELVEALLGLLSTIDPFECAALGRTTDLMSAMTRAPSTLTNRSPDGYTVLHLSAFFGHADTVDRLARYGAPIDAIAANPTLVRPLHSGVAAGSVRVVRILLEHGAEIDAPQRGGWTALHGAAHRGDSDMVELLLRSGASRGLAGEDGRDAAALAREAGHEALAKRIERVDGL